MIKIVQFFLAFIVFFLSSASFADTSSSSSPFHYDLGSKSSKCTSVADNTLHFLMSNDVGDQRGVCNNKCECLGSVLVSSKLATGYDVTFQCKNSGYSCNEKEDEDKDEGEEDIPTCNSDENLVFDPKTKKYSCQKKEEKCPLNYKEEKGKCVPDLKICHAKADYNSDKETYGSAQELCQMFADNLNKDTYSARNHTLKVKDVSQSSCSVGDNVYDHFLDISCDVEPPECDTGYTLDKDTNKCIKDPDDDQNDDNGDKTCKDGKDKNGKDCVEGDKEGEGDGDGDKDGDKDGDGDGDGEGTNCKNLPQVVCDFFKSSDTKMPEDVEVPTQDTHLDDPSTFDKDYVSISSQCPADIVRNIPIGSNSVTLTFPMTPICDFARDFMRPVLIFLAYLYTSLNIASALKV